MAGPRVPLLTNCYDSGHVYPLSLSLSTPVWQPALPSSSLPVRQSPSRTGSRPRSRYPESSHRERQHQQPPRHPAQSCQPTSTSAPCSQSYTATGITCAGPFLPASCFPRPPQPPRCPWPRLRVLLVVLPPAWLT